jgi:hypothetical protein
MRVRISLKQRPTAVAGKLGSHSLDIGQADGDGKLELRFSAISFAEKMFVPRFVECWSQVQTKFP